MGRRVAIILSARVGDGGTLLTQYLEKHLVRTGVSPFRSNGIGQSPYLVNTTSISIPCQ